MRGRLVIAGLLAAGLTGAAGWLFLVRGSSPREPIPDLQDASAPLDPRAPGPHYWQTSFGKVRARMCDELPGGVEVTVGEKAYRVRPLAGIELVDETTDRLLRRFRERLTTQPARRLEAV